MKAKPLCKQSVFIVPSRWFIGGLALGNFTEYQLNCGNIDRIIYYPNQTEIFSNVRIAGGIVILSQNESKQSHIIDYTVINGGKIIENTKRVANEFPIFISRSLAASIVRKVNKFESLMFIVGNIGAYSLSTQYRGTNKTDTYYNVVTSKGVYQLDVSNKENLGIRTFISCLTSDSQGQQTKHGKYKVISGFGILDEYTICTDSYITIGKFKTHEEANNLIKYLKTKFVRVIVQQGICGIHITKEKFRYVPIQNFSKQSDINWEESIDDIDKQLYRKYELSPQEIEYIENNIQGME